MTAQTNLCLIDANFLASEFELTEAITELCGNNIVSDIIVSSEQELLFSNKTSLLLTDGFEVKSGGLIQTMECDECLSNTDKVPLTENMNITPNPTSGAILVEMELDAISNLQLSLINSFGQTVKVFGQAQSYNVGFNAFTLDISDLPAGIYIIKATDGARISSRKVVRQ